MVLYVNLLSQTNKEAIDTLVHRGFKTILYNDYTWKFLNHDSVMKEIAIQDSVKLYNFIYENRMLSCDNNLFEKDWDTTLFWSYEEKNYKIYEDTLLINLLCRGNFVCPYRGIVSSKFGWRSGRLHQGIDIQLRTGDTIVSAFDGKVRYTGRYYGYGNAVVVRHHNGLETLYAHLSQINCAVNQIVTAGDLVGLGGMTGRASGPHLHFEIRYKNTPIDPQLIIDFANFDLLSPNFLIVPKHFSYAKEVNETQYYTIKSGDTLGAIAYRYRTSVKTLCKLNNMTETTTLTIGRNIRVR
jgi:murein DD-endopeptidase MepM/ murein hydrolase activator NlpD